MQNDGWQVEIDRATAAEWSQMLDLFNDANIYQTAAYGGVRWGENNLSRLVLKREGEVLGMAQLRIVRPTPLRFGVAYLRWGPLYERRGRPVDAQVAANVARGLEEEYVGRRRLCLRILPNAFVDRRAERQFNLRFPDSVKSPSSPIVPIGLLSWTSLPRWKN
jgi:hypothetical protein